MTRERHDPDPEGAARWIAERLARPAPFIGDLPAELRPGDVAQAYRVQRRLAEHLTAAGRGPVVGWKVGSTTPAMQRLLGVPTPAAGRVHAAGRLADGAVMRHAGLRRPGIECEVAVVLARTLDARAGLPGLDAVAAAVAAVHPAIELVDDRYGDFGAVGAPTMIADNFFHAALVLGAPVPGGAGLDLAAVDGVVLADGAERARGRGTDVLGHPLRSVQWLAACLAEQGEVLAAGQIVSTGSMTLPYWAGAGERIEVRIAGLGSVALTLAG